MTLSHRSGVAAIAALVFASSLFASASTFADPPPWAHGRGNRDDGAPRVIVTQPPPVVVAPAPGVVYVPAPVVVAPPPPPPPPSGLNIVIPLQIH